MKSCTHCKFADWKKTEAGKLHPSGEGQCTFEIKIPPLPASMFWIGKTSPKPLGGRISRREELHDHCTYYQRKD